MEERHEGESFGSATLWMGSVGRAQGTHRGTCGAGRCSGLPGLGRGAPARRAKGSPGSWDPLGMQLPAVSVPLKAPSGLDTRITAATDGKIGKGHQECSVFHCL